MNINLCRTATSSIIYYRSEWTWIKPMDAQSFAHKFGKLPSFYNIYVAAKLDKSVEEWIPTSAIPYQDYGDVSVKMVDNNNISVFNGCDVEVYIRVEALYINAGTITTQE